MSKLMIKKIFHISLYIVSIVTVLGIIGFLCLVYALNHDPLVKRHRGGYPVDWSMIHKKYLKEMYCTPEQPIDKGTIFAEAMQQYWQAEMAYLWNRYDAPDQVGGGEPDNVKDVCGLEWSKSWISSDTKTITQDNCYPFVVKDDGTRKVYKPEIDNYVYQPEFYNKDTDFIVLRNAINRDKSDNLGYPNDAYPKDCCRLLTYQEMIEEQNHIDENEFEVIRYYLNTRQDKISWYHIPDDELISKMFFLRIKRRHRDLSNEITYYPVSQCGKVPFFTYFYGL